MATGALAVASKVVEGLSGRPQDLARASAALRQITEGLQTLGSLGFPFYLAEGAEAPTPEWPRRVFHVDQPQGRVVNSRWELDELGTGWWPSLEQAQHQDGVETQFAGRGGVKRTGALAVTGPLTAFDRAEMRERNRRLAEQWKKEQGYDVE